MKNGLESKEAKQMFYEHYFLHCHASQLLSLSLACVSQFGFFVCPTCHKLTLLRVRFGNQVPIRFVQLQMLLLK